MKKYTHLLLAACFLLLWGMDWVVPSAWADHDTIKLLEPLPGEDGGVLGHHGDRPLNLFFCYFNRFYPWLIGVSAGISLLWCVWGGITIITSGGDPGKRGEGSTRFVHALLGLGMILFAAMILNFLNPTFFKFSSGSGPGGGPTCLAPSAPSSLAFQNLS